MGLRLGGTTERLRSIDRNNALSAHLPIGPNVTRAGGMWIEAEWRLAGLRLGWLAALPSHPPELTLTARRFLYGTHEAGTQHPPGLSARLEELDGVPKGHGGPGEGLQLADGQVPGRDPDGRGTARKPIHNGR